VRPTVRPPRREDFAAIVAVGEAFDRALTGTGDWSEDDVAHDWRALLDPERDAWVVEDAGAVVGYATFQDDGEGRFEADGYVHPDRFGQGIGALIVGLSERRAAERLEAVALPRVVIQNTVLHVDRAARDLLEGRGNALVWRAICEADFTPGNACTISSDRRSNSLTRAGS